MEGGVVQDLPAEESSQSIEEPNHSNRGRPTSRNRWRIAGIAGLLLTTGAIAAPRWLFFQSEAIRPSVAQTPVKTTVVELVQSYTVTRAHTGEVTPTRTSELGFERSGTLIWVGVDRGERVQTGEAIARLDTRNQVAQLNQLQAQKAQAEAQLLELRNGPRPEVIAAARSEVNDLKNQVALETIRRDRRESLHREGAISREQLDEVTFNRNALQERLTAAQNQLAELERGTRSEQIAAQLAVVRQLDASIAEIQITIAKSTLRAPFAGVIGERKLDEGTVVDAGQAIVRLVEETVPEVEVGVPVEVIDHLAIGSSQTLRIGQAGYSAEVIAIQPEVNPTTLTRTVVLALNDANLESIAPNQVARLEITQTVTMSGFWLPTTALIPGDRGLWSCFAVVDGKLERRDIEVLHTETDRVLVRGLLQAGDRVVTEGVHRLVPGQSVQSIY